MNIDFSTYWKYMFDLEWVELQSLSSWWWFICNFFISNVCLFSREERWKKLLDFFKSFLPPCQFFYPLWRSKILHFVFYDERDVPLSFPEVSLEKSSNLERGVKNFYLGVKNFWFRTWRIFWDSCVQISYLLFENIMRW